MYACGTGTIGSQLMATWTYDELIFQRIIQLLDFYINKHSKALVVRFDLTFPVNYAPVVTNDIISSFTQKIIQKYKRQGLNPYYIWVREQNSSDHPHYHFAILLNGHKIEKFYHVFVNAESLWASTLGTNVSGQVHHCAGNNFYKQFSNGIMIDRSKEDVHMAYNSVVTQLSYLAKAKDKRDYGDPWRNFGMSQLY
ncbi:inovirus Gp2 family protein [Desulfovibrio sulfodismutans]|uniref:Inovirus Gp2 family protein n=1 Tax=Desulfolutivibrio sulfodismutans TaxID=63561 RepID=A0A7K3NI06_9BACT|nr:inovirus-type Gp2 protein [Desulfolutivibrio sulfodismutans]NDY55818.1 inovirus Gp2 family protein [Desulfolutivibrio sulfodismutans]QLA14222.1 inovirus Gp2 family protein [Desulfolutivibrio sulfodismutans DSM 3696]